MSSETTKFLEAAQRYLAKGQFNKALLNYEQAVERTPHDIVTWLKIGDLHVRLNNVDSACYAYERVAELYTTQELFLKTIAVYKQVVHLDGKRVHVLIKLAETYAKLQLVGDAMSTYEQAVQVYQDSDQERSALQVMATMCELDPHNVPARIAYAEALSRLDYTKEAAHEFKASASLLKTRQRMDDYIKVAERLLFHQKDNVDLALELARLYLERRNTKRALAKLQLCFHQNPVHIPTLELLAEVFCTLQQKSKAVSVYHEIARIHDEAWRIQERDAVLHQILELTPNDAEAQRLLTESAEQAKSREAFKERTSHEPAPLSDPEPAKDPKLKELLNEAEVFERYGLTDNLVQCWHNILTLAPERSDIRERLKDHYLEIGDAARASAQLYALVDIYRQSDPAKANAYRLHADELQAGDDTLPPARTLLAPPPDVDISLEEDEDDLLDIEKADDPTPLDGGLTALIPMPEGDDADGALQTIALDAGELEQVVDNTALATDPTVVQVSSLPAEVASPEGSLSVEKVLDQIESYIDQGMLDEARKTLDNALKTHPDHMLLLDRRRELKRLEQERILMQPEESTTKIGADLLEELNLNLSISPVQIEALDSRVLNSVSDEEQSISINISDVDTQFDLGIAYKEMNLYGDAIRQFQTSAKDPKRECTSLTMIGLCLLEQGKLKDALSYFQQALRSTHRDTQETKGIHYELGQTYERLGKVHEAIYHYTQARDLDPRFRDVDARLASLGANAASAEITH